MVIELFQTRLDQLIGERKRKRSTDSGKELKKQGFTSQGKTPFQGNVHFATEIQLSVRNFIIPRHYLPLLFILPS